MYTIPLYRGILISTHNRQVHISFYRCQPGSGSSKTFKLTGKNISRYSRDRLSRSFKVAYKTWMDVFPDSVINGASFIGRSIKT